MGFLLMKYSKKKYSKKKKKTKTKKKKLTLTISKEKYKSLVSKSLISKSKLSKKESKQLDDALYVKYCSCLRSFESRGDFRGYGICMKSVYKNRGKKPPKNASNECKVIFKK